MPEPLERLGRCSPAREERILARRIDIEQPAQPHVLSACACGPGNALRPDGASPFAGLRERVLGGGGELAAARREPRTVLLVESCHVPGDLAERQGTEPNPRREVGPS